MKIDFFFTSDGEPFALFTWGHVDTKKFQRAAAPTRKKYRDWWEDHGRGILVQTFMRKSPEAEDSEYPWEFCKMDDEGAEPVTAIRWS